MNISIWRSPNITGSLMRTDQDTTVFKRYLFGWKYWVGHCCETWLLPQCNSYPRMVPGFVRCSFRAGLHVTQIELDKANQRRTSDEWWSYSWINEANTAHCTAKMKEIHHKQTLIQFFDVGINLEGFWNYDQMAIQVEDVVDVLSVKFLHFYFLFLLDQSSGHEKMQLGTLN